MNSSVLTLPVHIKRRIGASPTLMSVFGLILGLVFYLQSLSGAHTLRVRGITLDPVTHIQFIAVWILIATCVVVFSIPIWSPVELTIDEAGVRKTMNEQERFWAWSDIADIEVTERGGFRGRGGAIRFTRVGEGKVPRPVDLSPGMFKASAAELSSLIREGLARWGGVGGGKGLAAIS